MTCGLTLWERVRKSKSVIECNVRRILAADNLCGLIAWEGVIIQERCQLTFCVGCKDDDSWQSE